MYVEFGNDHAIEGFRDQNADDPELVQFRALEGQRVTQIVFPEGTGLQEAFSTAVTALQYHIAEGEKPTWIESDSDGLQSLLGEHFGVKASENKRPKTWGKATGAPQMPKPGALGVVENAMIAVALMALGLLSRLSTFAVFQAFFLAMEASLQLRTDAGRDFQSRVMGDTASTGTGVYAAANYIALTANSTAPAAGNTTLTGEITTGTLARAQATYAHTNGTATYTLTKTFTSDSSVTIAKIGVFNAAATGTMVFETLLNATATLVSGDQLQITETVTL